MRTRVIGSVLLPLVLVATTACTLGHSSETSSVTGHRGGTLRVGMSGVPFYVMDPSREWFATTWELFRCCLVRTLVSYDVSEQAATTQPVPDLASEPPDVSIDGLTWTFRLKPGLRYAPPLQDVEITSGDIVRALLRLATLDGRGQGLGFYLRIIQGWNAYAHGDATSIAGLQTPDAHTLRIVETRPDATLPYVLALPEAAPIPPLPGSPDARFGVATGHDTGDHPTSLGGYGQFLVASGPYMVEGADTIDFTRPPRAQTPAPGFDPWLMDERFNTTHFGSLTLVRNPSWDAASDPLRAALSDRIELRGGEDPALFRQLAAGSLDLVFDLTPSPGVLHRYQTHPELRPLIQASRGAAGIRWATFNLALPPFDDVAVRRAVAFGLDRTSLVALIRRFDGGSVTVADHFVSDTLEASLLSGWSPFPGRDGAGDIGAARDALATSRYVKQGRCVDPACRGVSVVVDDRLGTAIPGIRRLFRSLGMSASVRVGSPYACTDPTVHVGLCIGDGWYPDYPNAASFLAEFFGSDGSAAATRLGATPDQLRTWGYSVTHVPSVDADIDRCIREVGSTQPTCWARLDQYLVGELMPAIPIAFLGALRLSSPGIGTLPWDETISEPALERIAAPTG